MAFYLYKETEVHASDTQPVWSNGVWTLSGDRRVSGLENEFLITEDEADLPAVPEPGSSIQIPPLEDSRVTRLAFRRRFTFEERVTIETAAESNIALRVYLKDQDAAPWISLTDPLTLAGLNHLVTAGILTDTRVTEITMTPIQESERP